MKECIYHLEEKVDYYSEDMMNKYWQWMSMLNTMQYTCYIAPEWKHIHLYIESKIENQMVEYSLYTKNHKLSTIVHLMRILYLFNKYFDIDLLLHYLYIFGNPCYRMLDKLDKLYQ